MAHASTESAERSRPKSPILYGSWPGGGSDADATDHRDQNHFRCLLVSPGLLRYQYCHVRLYLCREKFRPERLSYDLTVATLAFALTTNLAILVQLTLVTGAAPSLTSLVAWAEFALCLAVPFFFSGIVVSLALTRSPTRSERSTEPI